MKRKSLFIALFCFSVYLSSGQTAKWDSTYRPGIYEFKVQLYESYPKSKNDIVFLGNSITDRVDWNELLGKSNVRNRGISGDITFGVLQRLHQEIGRAHV